MKNSTKEKIFHLLFFIIIANLAGIIGSFFTFDAIDAWYKDLIKPSFSPPDWVFAPVWFLLYILMGTASYLVWSSSKKHFTTVAFFFYGVQLFLNALWSVLFFGLQSPGLAFVEIIFLQAFIIVTAYLFFRVNKTASYLMLPYIFWVTFAGVLNYYILLLNS